jgi:hypothetical protein
VYKIFSSVENRDYASVPVSIPETNCSTETIPTESSEETEYFGGSTPTDSDYVDGERLSIAVQKHTAKTYIVGRASRIRPNR